MPKLYEFICKSAENAVFLQRPDGAMPAGHNGLYKDAETPVRNTSHWLITLLKAYEITQEQHFLTAAQKAQAYLYTKEARPMGATFWHRLNPEKDFCNGLVGQAWTLEALAVSAPYFEEDRAMNLAKEVFLLHPFDQQLGLWRRVSVDGSYLPFDMAFNHQLWFAASGALIMAEDAGIQAQVLRFMDRLHQNLTIYASGLIFHSLKSSGVENANKLTRLSYHLKEKLQLWQLKDKYLHHKAIGYHAFNLYAFALLKQQIPDHSFWSSAKFKKILAYMGGQPFKQGLTGNQYGYPYNPAGIENAFALEVFFPERKEEASAWLSEQFKNHFDTEKKMLSKNTTDAVTLAARLYEATRLSDLPIAAS